MNNSYLSYKDLENQNISNKIRRTALFILMFITLVQQMPIIKDVMYTELRLILYLGFALLTLASLFPISKYINYSLSKLFILSISYTFLLYIVILLFSDKTTNISVFELLIPFGIFLCSLRTDFTRKQLSLLLISYIALSTILGVSLIFYYGEGFEIMSSYFVTGKNQVGPIIGIAIVITLVWIFNKKNFLMKFPTVINIIFLVLLISSIAVIRNRSTLVGVLLILLMLLIPTVLKFKPTYKNIVLLQIGLIILAIAIVAGGFNSISLVIWEAITSNYQVTDLNSLSAGRTSVYLESLLFSFQNPLLGELSAGQTIHEVPHNYILNKWVNFGVIGSLPIVMLYLYLWFFVIRNFIKRNKNNNTFTLPVWVLLFSLIVSLFEYTYPFGPGSSQLMLWLLMGQYFKHNISPLTQRQL